MADLNNISIIGRMTHDIDERAFGYTSNGKARLNISIAVNDGYGENQYTSYIDVVVWGKQAENLRPYLSKGKQVGITGRIRQDRWESNGQKNSRVMIVAENVQLLGGRNDNAGTQQQAPQQAENDGGSFQEDIPF